MPIKKRAGDDGEAGSNPGLIRRKKFKRLKSGLVVPTKKKVELSDELSEIVSLWNNKSPGVIRPVTSVLNYGRLSTGILTVDIALAGGFKNSRTHMIYGERSAGKTTVMAKVMKTALDLHPDEQAIIVDVEGTIEKVWLRMLGVDVDRVMIVEPDTGEDAVDQLDAMIRAEGVCFVGLDSIAMVTPFKEIDSSAEDNQIGLQARLIGKMLRRVQNAILQERRRQRYPIAMLLNQFRMKAGLVFGDPRTLPGGKALEFVTSQQLEMTNKEHKDEKTGIVMFNEHTAKITKDKTGGRFKEAKFKLIRDESTDLPVGWIDQAKSIIEYGTRIGVVSGKYQIEGVKPTFRSAEALRDFLVENPKVEAAICARIVQAYRSKWGIED